jgi:hypothetical protein
MGIAADSIESSLLENHWPDVISFWMVASAGGHQRAKKGLLSQVVFVFVRMESDYSIAPKEWRM